MVSLAEVLRLHWRAYEQTHGVLPSQRRAVAAILSCRTPAQGGHLHRCLHCRTHHFSYHSCHHRACPQCGSMDKAAWLSKQLQRLLPVPYFLVTFTVPAALRSLFQSHQKLFYHAFFVQSAATLQEVAARHLHAELGFLGVLQTWSRQLFYHPHIHYLIPGAGLSPNRLRWIRLKNPHYLLPQKVLARRFRHRFKNWLRQQQPACFSQLHPKIWRAEWVIDVQPVGTGKKALEYLATYIHRTALGPHRLVNLDAEFIGLRYYDRHQKKSKVLRLHPHQFLRRFLQHVLPRGFQRLRSFGWLSPAAKSKWQRIQALLDWKTPALIPLPPQPSPQCPLCHRPMLWVGRLARAPP